MFSNFRTTCVDTCDVVTSFKVFVKNVTSLGVRKKTSRMNDKSVVGPLLLGAALTGNKKLSVGHAENSASRSEPQTSKGTV